MAIILPRQRTLSEALGTGLGAGLSTGLPSAYQALERKLQMQPLIEQYGLPRGFENYPPALQTELLKRERLRGVFGPEEGIQPQIAQQPQGMEGLQQQTPGMMPTQQSVLAPQTYSPEQKAILQNAKRMAQATGDPRLWQQAQLEVAKMQGRERIAEQKLSGQKSLKLGDYNRNFKSNVFAKEDEALGKRTRFNKLAQYSRSGELDSPAYTKLMKKVGLDFLLDKSTIGYEKLVADTAREYAAKTKGRISELIFENFLKSLPSLTTSKEARQEVEGLLNSLNDADINRAKITRNIIKEKGNLDTYDLEDLVSERMNDVYKKIEDRLLAQSGKTVIDPEVYKQLGNPEDFDIGQSKTVGGKTYILVEE